MRPGVIAACHGIGQRNLGRAHGLRVRLGWDRGCAIFSNEGRSRLSPWAHRSRLSEVGDEWLFRESNPGPASGVGLESSTCIGRRQSDEAVDAVATDTKRDDPLYPGRYDDRDIAILSAVVFIILVATRREDGVVPMPGRYAGDHQSFVKERRPIYGILDQHEVTGGRLLHIFCRAEPVAALSQAD